MKSAGPISPATETASATARIVSARPGASAKVVVRVKVTLTVTTQQRGRRE